jgi:hypothetical protein
MSHYSYIAGYITYPSSNGHTEARQKNLEHFQSILNTLPEVDTFPFVSRGMFSITPETQIYRDGVIHFATSMKDVLSFWQEWEEKFEQLLRHCGDSWYEARVYVWDENIGNLIFVWRQDMSRAVPWSKTKKYAQEIPIKEAMPGWFADE